MTERTFDRVPQFDPRSRSFSIKELVEDRPLRSYTWNGAPHLDQGVEGACVGHAWAHEIAARPKARPTSSEMAFGIYRRAQELDEWDGTDYEGTSVLAGAKVVQESGLIAEYRWAFSLRETLLALAYSGPVVLGVNWHEGMMNPDSTGFLRVEGSIVGGHAIMAKGVNVKGKYVRLHNSWGDSWGRGGDAFISFDDLEKLLNARGEACVPRLRK